MTIISNFKNLAVFSKGFLINIIHCIIFDNYIVIPFRALITDHPPYLMPCCVVVTFVVSFVRSLIWILSNINRTHIKVCSRHIDHQKTGSILHHNKYIFILQNIDVHFAAIDGVPKIFFLLIRIFNALQYKTLLRNFFCFVLFNTKDNITTICICKSRV